MYQGQRVLAVVPARSGSQGIPDKNLQRLNGTSLIGWAGRVLEPLTWIDRRLISTDSPVYAQEGARYGLEAPFLRPAHLSTDEAGAVETVQHAVTSVEAATGERFNLIVVVEPTSPLRLPDDVEQTVQRLVASGADSAVTVSPLPSKAHPLKVLRLTGEQLAFYLDGGRAVVGRQHLEPLYWRNGVCYALTRSCLLEQATFFGRRCVAVPIAHLVVNIDEPWELEWAQCALDRKWVTLESLVGRGDLGVNR